MTAPVPAGPAAAQADVLLAASALLARRGGEIESRVSGGSMGRTLPPGTAVRIRLTAGADCRRGDLVAFLAGTTLVTHRLVGRGRRTARQRFLITRGDGTWLCDPPVADDRVVGVVVAWNDGVCWRRAEELPVPDAGRGALLVQGVLVRALDLHLWAARGVYIISRFVESIVARLRSHGARADAS